MTHLTAIVLAQALVSAAPTYDNLATLPPAATVRWAPSLEAGTLPREFAAPDTVRRRPRAVSLSDGYYQRLEIHRIAAYATLPLFVVEYFAGQRLLEGGSGAPLWAETVHKPAAYALAGAFTVNTVTGLWNLAEAKQVEQGKTRRWVHTALMLAADIGFIYGAHIAPSTSDIDARLAAGQRGGWTPHKRVTVASMGLATAGMAMMYLWK